MEQKNDSRSLLMLISSMFIFGTLGLVRRYIPQSSAFLAFSRGMLGAVFLIVFCKLSGKRFFGGLSRLQTISFAVSGAVMGVNWLLLFEAMNYTTVAIATLCYYMEPTIVLLLSPLLFKEKLSPKKLLCAAAALLGMVLVSGVVGGASAGVGSFKGVLLGLAAACCYSTVVIMNKKTPGADAYEKSVIQLAAAGAVMIPYLLLTRNIGSTQFTPGIVAMILVAGLLHTGVAYVLYFGCMDGLRAQTVAVLSYIDPVMALLVSMFLLGEPISAAGLIGAVLIIGAAIACEIEPSRG